MTDQPATNDAAPEARYAVKLPGPGLGEVVLADVVEFLRGLVDLVAHAAGSEIAYPVGLPGRRRAVVEGASRLRLVGLSSGGLIAEVAPAVAPVAIDSLGLDVPSLSEASLGALFDAARGSSDRPDLAAALIEFASRMQARRPSDPVVFIDRRGGLETELPIDDTTLARLRDVAGRGRQSGTSLDRVTGRLYEASVDTDEARLQTPTGETVKIEYDAGLEDEIKRLLGNRASLSGDVEYDLRTHRVREIRARSIDSGVQLELDGVDFWRDPTLVELADSVGAGPVIDPDQLHFEASDDEWDELYRVLDASH